MKELTNIFQEAGQQFIDDLFKDYLLVTEKLSGSTFSFERHGDQIQFFKGSNKMPINLIDRTLMMYYEQAIQYMTNSVKDNLEDIPEYWRFCFQYFVNNKPGAIEYDNLPINNLVLTHIQVRNAKGKIAKVIEDPRVLRDWASAFQVTPLIPIFSGYLKEHQKKKIREFLSIPKEDHLEVFGTNSFAQYLITCLNPNVISTTLQNDLNKPIDSIIFKFFKPGTSQIFTAKMIDPYTQALMKDKVPVDLRRAPADINEILLLDILAFIEERGLRSGELLSDNPPERYLELISSLFNDYIAKRGNDLKKLNIEKAEFAKGPEFNLNTDLIKNNRTKELLQKSESLQNLYKIMLGSLRKKRNPNRIGAVMTKNVVEDFNKLVSKISDAINKETDGKFKTFGDYLNNKVTEEIEDKGLEELIVEEKVLNYNKFINLGKVDLLNEAKDQPNVKERQANWLKHYEKIIKSKDHAGAKYSSEYLRANFGANDGEAETNIQKYLKTLKLSPSSYKIEGYPSKHYHKEIGKTFSGQFHTYKIILKSNKNILDQDFKRGDIIYITNRYKVSAKTGEAAVIKGKDLTPDAMGLTKNEYHNPQPLFAASSSYVRTTTFPDRYKEFIIESMKVVMNNNKNANKFKDFETYASFKSSVIYKVGSNFFDGIDQVSVSNFSNDFGEVLGGFMMFNVIQDTGSGLKYPTESNAALTDFMFDGWSISSKAGAGGTPSGSSAMKSIDAAVKNGTLELNMEEQSFYDNVVKVWLNPYELNRNSGTYNKVMNLAADALGPNATSGYSYVLNEARLNQTSITREALIKFLDDLLLEDENKFDNFIKTLSQKTGAWRGKIDANKYRIEYIERYEKKDPYRMGLIFYPIMVETANALNKEYAKQLTVLYQKLSDVKQVYLDTEVKKSAFVFKTKAFSSADFKFEQKGQVWNPFSAMMGIKMIK
jgi:hypothetical protein